MPAGSGKTDDVPIFPILRGESVGEHGEFSGRVYIVATPDDLHREWASDEIAVLHHNMETYIRENPGELDALFEKVSVVLAEFGEAIGEFSSFAYGREAIGIVKLQDACFVLENDMHIRVVAFENTGDIFFID